MKKNLLLIIMLLFAIGTSTVYAQNTTDEKEVVLRSLGIINEEFGDKKIITTEEYISAVVNMMTDNEIPQSSSYSYGKSIGICGGISGFKLKDAVSKEYVLKIALRALGYDKIIQQGGETEGFLLSLASDAGLTKNVDMSELNGKNLIGFLYNLSKACMMEISFKGDSYKLSASDETLLYHYRNIKVIQGTVTATNYTSLIKADGLTDKQVEIDNHRYAVINSYSPEILGARVKAYLIEDSETIIYVAAEENRREMLEVKSDYVDDVDSRFEYIDYTLPGEVNQKKVKLSPTVKVIYNGKFYADYTVEDLKPAKGKLVFSDVDIDGKYDIVFVYSYRTMVADQVSYIKKSITNKFTYTDAEPVLVMDEYDKINIISSDGQTLSFNDIKKGNVLNIATSKGGDEKTITIFVSSQKVTGTVTQIDYTNDILTIDDAQYKISYVYYDAINNGDSVMSEIKVGNSTILYLDNDGDVAYAQNDRLNGCEYLYVLKTKPFDDAGLEYGVRALNLSGDWKNYRFAKKIKISGEERSYEPESAYKYLSGKIGEPQLVMAKVNKNDEILEIKLAETTTESNVNAFTRTPQARRIFWSFDGASAQHFDFADYVTRDTPVILTPNESRDLYTEKAYEVGGIELLSHWYYCTYSAYNKNENNIADIVVAMNQNADKGSDFMLNSVGTGLNEDDEPVKEYNGELAGIGGVTIKEYEPGLITEDFVNGDIMTIVMRDGKIKSAKKKYSLSEGPKYKEPSGDFASDQEIMGVVKAVDAELGLITLECSEDGSKVYTLNRHTRECSYTMYNRDSGKYEKATINEIEIGDFVIAKTFSATIRSCYIIKPEN